MCLLDLLVHTLRGFSDSVWHDSGGLFLIVFSSSCEVINIQIYQCAI